MQQGDEVYLIKDLTPPNHTDDILPKSMKILRVQDYGPAKVYKTDRVKGLGPIIANGYREGDLIHVTESDPHIEQLATVMIEKWKFIRDQIRLRKVIP